MCVRVFLFFALSRYVLGAECDLTLQLMRHVMSLIKLFDCLQNKFVFFQVVP